MIALYCNFCDEVDTSMLVDKSLLDNKIVVLPKIINKIELEFYGIRSAEEITSVNSFGIREPVGEIINYVDKEKIDLIVVPGICFDTYRQRVGFGAGYYDRCLNSFKKTIKIGICFDEQLLCENCIQTCEYDVKMDMIITDKRVIREN